MSNALTTGTGEFTIPSIPSGTYTVNVSSTSSSGPWTATGQANYFIGADVGSTNTFTAAQAISGGSLELLDNNSKIVPGANQLSLRNHADNADNILVEDSGTIHVRDGIIIDGGGMTITAGPLNGNSTITTSQEISGGDLQASGGTVGVFSSPTRLLGRRGLTGSPTSGTYNAGDIGMDSNGTVFTASAAGTPGTWHSIGWVHWLRYVVGPGGSIDTSSNPGGDLPMPSGFNHAMVVVSNAVDTTNNVSGQFGGMQIAINGGSLVTSASYIWSDFNVSNTTGGTATSAVSGSPNGQDIAWSSFVLTGGGVGLWPSSSVIWLPGYVNSSVHQTAMWDILQVNSSTVLRRMGGGYGGFPGFGVGNITTLHFFARTGTMAAGTTFDLYVMP